MLRQQLAALSAWHIVNILVAYELADEDAPTLNRLPAPALIEKVIAGVEREARLAGGKLRSVASRPKRAVARRSQKSTRR